LAAIFAELLINVTGPGFKNTLQSTHRLIVHLMWFTRQTIL